MVYTCEENPFMFPRPKNGLREGIVQRIHGIADFILFSATWVALAGGGLAVTSCFIQGIPLNVPVILVMFLVAFSVYNMNRKTDEEEDAINHQERFAFTKKFARPLFYGAIAAYVLALILGAWYGWQAFIVVLVPLVCGILYSEPLLPSSWEYRRFKEIPVVKNLVVAIAWSLPLALLPVLMTPGTSISLGAGIAGVLFVSYFIFASVLPDIRDREGDAATGVRTIPVVIGVERTKIILTLQNIALGGLIVGISYCTLSLLVTLIILAAVVYSQLCIGLLDGNARTDLVCDVLADGQFVFIGLALGILVISGGVL